jgi:hypothetical protein
MSRHDTENPSVINDPSELTPENIADISGPDDFLARPSGNIDDPNELNALSQASIDSPDSASARPATATAAPTAKSAENKTAVTIPVNKTVQSKAIIGLPLAKTAQIKPVVDSPEDITAENKVVTGLPSSADAIAKAVTPAPVNKAAQPATPAGLPVTLTPSAGVPLLPPFPLNHARVLYNNLLEGSTVTSSTGENPEYTLVPNTANKWNFETTGWVKFVLDESKQIDTICIGAQSMSNNGYSVQPFYRTSEGGTLVAFSAARVVTTSNAVMFHLLEPINAAVIEIYTTEGFGAGDIGFISAGIALQMQRPFFNGHVPITDGDVTQYYSNRTESGEIIGQQIRRQGYETSASWQNIDDTWYRTYFAPFKQAAKLRPFFFAWNLLEYPDDVGLCRISEDVSAPMQNGTRTKRSISMNLLGAG